MLRNLWMGFWYLLPANPILVRVVQIGSRRVRHLWLRTAYLATLIAVVLLSLVSFAGENAALSEMAKRASNTFQWASMTQLGLMCFLAPVFTAATITQERDAQTLNILLSTPLTNAQIVFGSLMSRLFFVILLLLAGLPVFFMTMIYGGVTTSQIAQSFSLAAATAVITGSIAILVAMTSVGTRRTILSFYLVIATYLVAVYALARWPYTWVDASPPNLFGQKMSWLAALHPFLALDVALNRVHAPPMDRLAGSSIIARYALAFPGRTYVLWTGACSLLFTLVSVLQVRRGVKTGEATLISRLRDLLRIRSNGTLTRRPRTVWANPVAWREAKTRVSSGGLIRWATILGGCVAEAVLFVYYTSGTVDSGRIPQWLAGLAAVQFAIVLIIATNTAATSMTKERESKTLDMLLATPMTSRYILWGKLRGLVSFAAPVLVVPVVGLLVFGFHDLSGPNRPPVVWPETGLMLGTLLVIYTGLACVLGLRVSLTSRTNVRAVMYGIGLLIVICGVLTAGGVTFVEAASGEFGAFVAPFTPFTLIRYVVDPPSLFDSPRQFAARAESTRLAATAGCCGAALLYAVIAWKMYAFLVREFDMTMRRQGAL